MTSTQQDAPAARREPLVVGPPAPAPARIAGRTEDVEDVLSGFMQAIQDLVFRLRQRDEEMSRILQITERVNYGVILEDILDHVYRDMRAVIPYNRIGFSLIDPQKNTVTAHWARSDRPMLLSGGYEAPLAGSTLQDVMASGQPRIINDLEEYFRAKPESASTELIVGEGMRSSLTCPLIVQGRPVGFMFFSSIDKHTYSRVHVAFFQQIAGQLAAIVEKGRLYDVLTRQKAIIEEHNRVMTKDLEMARQVQRALIPAEAPPVPGVEIAFAYEPAVQIGGDVLDLIPLADDQVMLFVGDAMGHGIKAALVMSVVKTALQEACMADSRPEAMLARINRTVFNFFGDQFVTAACCVLDGRSGLVRTALAGHPKAIWLSARMGEIAAHHSDPGLPLGIVPQTDYVATDLVMGRGDTLVLYTDGIIEAFDPHRNEYGLERLERLIRAQGRSSAREILAAVMADVKVHAAGNPMADDLALLVVKRKE